MRVIGTAGHVDHGKSTLVKSLTGIDPDRLTEEKAREMTIDLGFAWLTLPNGEQVGVVDVPGHRDFIENMLAGIGGIDAAVLVIAADEGVMPQTREHLAILDLLGIENGIVALTKIDMVEDAEWIDLVSAEVREVLQGTTLADADIIPVSAYTGQGIDRLLDALTALLERVPPRVDYNAPRLPIDRIFTISGFGTVVTGTLIGGSLHVGDEVEVQPSGIRGRIRGLQSHKQSVTTIATGSRAAVNLTGVDKRTLKRGEVLTRPGQLQATALIDVRFRYLPEVTRPLKHNAEVKFFSGAAEANARVRLLADQELQPGAESWLQLRLEAPLALAQGDRFILRYPSPGETIGGGLIVNPHPARRWKRLQSAVIEQLELRAQGSPAERLAQAAHANEPIKRPNLQKQVGLSDAELRTAVAEALEVGLLVEFPDGGLMASSAYQQLQQRAKQELRAYHTAQPLQIGMLREELRSRLGLKAATFNALLDGMADVVAQAGRLRMSDHGIRLTPAQTAKVEALREALAEAPFTPPSYSEAAQLVGEDVLRALIELGEIVQVHADVIFGRAAYEQMTAGVLQIIDDDGGITAGALRDRFSTSRKYAVSLLEHLDSIGVTKRDGDSRTRGPNAWRPG